MAKEKQQSTAEASAPEMPFSSEVKSPPEPLVWCVNIPGSLIGQRFVAAADEKEAGDKYKAVCGVTSHATPLTATLCEFTTANLPEGVELFG